MKLISINHLPLHRFLVRIAIVFAITSLFSACSTPPDATEAYKNETPTEIYQKGRAALIDKSYGEATKRFEALDVQYPFSPQSEAAQLDLIYSYYMKEDYALAVAAADHYIRMHPIGPNVDYAFYMRGVSNYYQNLGIFERIFSLDLATRDLTQIQKSYSDFNEVIVRFPQSPYAPGAHQYMIYLRNVMADHELHVAEYYYNRKAYIAAADRASNLVAHYQGAPAVIDGLIVMAKSYHALGLTQLEQDTLAVLHYNYPNLPMKSDRLSVRLDS